MTCREFADVLDNYLSGALPSEARLAFDEHLEICVNCQKYLKSYEETVKLGKRAFDDVAELPADIPEDLVKAVLAASRQAR